MSIKIDFKYFLLNLASYEYNCPIDASFSPIENIQNNFFHYCGLGAVEWDRGLVNSYYVALCSRQNTVYC